jgi:hypothetical protein
MTAEDLQLLSVFGSAIVGVAVFFVVSMLGLAWIDADASKPATKEQTDVLTH